jgi:hypothetical protein
MNRQGEAIMPHTAHLRPTVIQRLRAFLEAGGQGLAPWSSFDDVMDRLRDVLHERRDQAGTWTELECLIEELQRDALHTQGLAAPEAEVLSRSKIAEIVQELRAATNGSSSSAKGNGAAKRFLSDRTAAAMACLTLLGTAFVAACGSSDTGPVGQAGGSTGGSGGVDDSGVQDALTDLFRDGSPDDIASQLEAMVNDAAAEDGGGGTGGMAPAYKGIVFEEFKPS